MNINKPDCYCRNIDMLCRPCLSVLSNKELRQINGQIINDQQYYYHTSVTSFMMIEYGVEQIPKSRREKRRLKKLHRQNYRIKILHQAFDEHRLQVKDYGDCYSFIHYGTPTVDEVVHNELTRLHNYQTRREELTIKLKNIGIKYSEEYSDCIDFVHSRSNKTADEVVRSIELERFLLDKTDYEQLLPIHGKLRAQELALREYYRDKDEPTDSDQDGSNSGGLRVSFD